MKFGEYVKQRRLAMGLSLRAFCLKFSEDPSNWSKMERAMSPPPESYERLLKIGHYLDMADDSEEMRGFFDMASVDRGRIPADILDDATLMKKLPLVFRTLRGAPEEEDLMKLADIIREAHTPHGYK